MNQFAKKFIAEWRRLKLPLKEQTVIVAVSGGADSVSLLAVLHELQTLRKLNLKIVVGHFNHQLRGADSETDAEFVKKLSDKFESPFEIRNPQSAIRNQKGNLEQAARRVRYDFLFDAAKKHNAFAVLTAHTLNDQAETLLLRLIRGSGADGLSAMTALRLFDAETRRRGDAENQIEEKSLLSSDNSFDEHNSINVSASPRPRVSASPLLVRPLLTWAMREDTENFCQKLDINFRRDTMNEDERFARVRVRKKLIPFLKKLNPGIIETLATTADLLREDADALNDIAAEFLSQHQFSLPAAECLRLAPALRRRILRIWLAHQRGDLRRITAAHLRATESLIINNEGSRIIELPGGDAVTRRGGKLVFLPKVEKTTIDN